MRFLFLIFIAVPLIEMLVLFEVSDVIGGLNTVAMVVLTAVIGVQILKRQGLSTLLRANQRLETGELPAEEIVEGMLLASAGALLLTPGFITDTLGFIFLTGPLRRPLARRIIRAGVVRSMGSGGGSSFTFFSYGAGPSSGGSSGSSRGPRSGNTGRHGGNTVEGEYADESRDRLEESDDERRH